MREEDGRRRRKADTELKTKTSHVNVGKKYSPAAIKENIIAIKKIFRPNSLFP